ncbi:MAG: type II toxin-antitoxin system VapC family toxin [Candidatus Melainabacteria bacterium]|nr:type II toxin-antitoxin system VapC family toxin [Candidatus Melainabacteria bacterium]
MKGFLLDTNCISELVRIKPDKHVVDWFKSMDEELLYLSVLTLGEIRKGLENLPQVKRRARLETWLVELKHRFAGRILPIEEAVAEQWGMLAHQARRKGKPLAIIDGLLAATAVHHSLTLVTRNINDFTLGQVSVLNPWGS